MPFPFVDFYNLWCLNRFMCLTIQIQSELDGVFDTDGSLLQSDGYDRVGGLSLGLIGIVGEIVLWALLFVDAITCWH